MGFRTKRSSPRCPKMSGWGTGRSSSLNASVVTVHRKVASLAGAAVVASDLALPDEQRRLLHGVTGTEHPTTDEAALRDHIAHLTRRLYGVNYAPDAPEVATSTTTGRRAGTAKTRCRGPQASARGAVW